jgi:hypothetical protein
MLTVARCTRAAVWTQVTGLAATVSEAQGQSWEPRGTLPSLMEPLQSLVVTADETLLIPGMECCSTHNLACSQVTELGHRFVAVRAQLVTQGTSTIVRDGDGAGYAVNPRTNSVALLTSLALCCQTRIEAILKVHTAEGNMADLIGVECTDLQAVAFLLERRIYVQLMADTVRAVAGVLSGWKEVD